MEKCGLMEFHCQAGCGIIHRNVTSDKEVRFWDLCTKVLNGLIKGNNEIGVGVLSRPEKLTGSVVLEEVEIGITYPNSTR